MKIADGTCMNSAEIRRILEDAETLLMDRGVILSPSRRDHIRPRVRDWLRSKRTKRSPRQAALCYLNFLSEDIE